MSASDKKKLRKEEKAATLTEKQLKEQKEAKKLKTYTLTFAVVMLLVVAIVIGVTVRGPIESAVNKKTHAITFGEHKLTTADFNYYYIDAIDKYCLNIYNDYYKTFGNYWSMFLGFNTGEPLDDQMFDKEKGTTWAQWFVDTAIDNAKQIYAIYEEALKNGHKLTEDEEKALKLAESDLDELAKGYGYSSGKEYLRLYYGNGATIDNYLNYYTVSTYATSYVAAHSETYEYTDEAIREYEKDKYLNYTKFDYCFYLIDVNNYLGEGTKDADGKVTYTDQQKADALTAAKKDADALKAAGITDAAKFTEAIKALAINKDNKNAACQEVKDEFYEKANYKEIQEWLSKDDRKAKDFDILPIVNKTGEGDNAKEETTGYLVILFQERDDCLTNLVSVRHMLSPFTFYWDADGNQKVDEASKPNVMKEAEKWLKEWKDGKATEDSFGELANKYSKDSDGKDGGLLEDIYPGEMVAKFDVWCFDKDRKPGDTAVIETELGYHVMYFVKHQDQTYRDAMIESDMLSEDVTEWIEDLKKDLKVEQVNLKGIAWDRVV